MGDLDRRLFVAKLVGFVTFGFLGFLHGKRILNGGGKVGIEIIDTRRVLNGLNLVKSASVGQ